LDIDIRPLTYYSLIYSPTRWIYLDYIYIYIDRYIYTMKNTLCLCWLNIVVKLVGMWCIGSSRWHFELHGRKISCCKREFSERFWCNRRHQKSVGKCLSRNCFLCRHSCSCCSRFCRSSKLIQYSNMNIQKKNTHKQEIPLHTYNE